jgi:D-serine deaminase-like pyridoxal phosphate-dependent protein
MIDYSDWIRILKDESLPVALVDLDAFERNVEKLIAQVLPSGKNLRIASKSIRVPSLIQRVANRGKPFQGVMCYSAQEALVLSDLGIDDLLVAYPTLQREDLRALHEIHSKGMKVTLVVDSADGLSAIASASRRDNPFPVLIDIDASLRLFGGALGLTAGSFEVLRQREVQRAHLGELGLQGADALDGEHSHKLLHIHQPEHVGPNRFGPTCSGWLALAASTKANRLVKVLSGFLFFVIFFSFRLAFRLYTPYIV